MLWATFRLSNTVCIEGECQKGVGKLAYKTGEIYEGEINEYQANGTGKIYYLNGDIYSGEMFNGKLHGKGVLTLNNSKEKGFIEMESLVISNLDFILAICEQNLIFTL